MASNKDRLTGSPQSIRKGNEDPYHHDSEADNGFDLPRKSDGINDRAWKIEQDRDGSGNAPATRGG